MPRSDKTLQPLRKVGLVHTTDSTPGIRRVKRGGGFAYLQPDGSKVNDDETLERIASIVIPPAWTEVWISSDPAGHLQATGRDARGRKQYRYHPRWRELRDRDKFDLLVPFGEALPRLRDRVARDLGSGDVDRTAVLALVVALIDETLARVGNREYARDNDSFGLTTLRDRHARVDGARLELSFVGKGGVEHSLALKSRRLARRVARCREIPGHVLFQYRDSSGARRAVDSGMVNEYVRDAMGAEFTTKCFRTWGGTVLAGEALAARNGDDVPNPNRVVTEAVAEVAKNLGNTPAVCRAHYIHPAIFEAHEAGDLARRLRRRHAGNTPSGLEPAEAAVLDVLRDFGSG